MKVYLITDGEGRYKIGRSSNVGKRLDQLQTSCPSELKVVDMYESNLATVLEPAMHRRHLSKNLHNEWFELSHEDVMSFQSDCKKIESNLIFLSQNSSLSNPF